MQIEDYPIPEADSKAIDYLVLYGSVPAVHAFDVMTLMKEVFGDNITRDTVAFCEKYGKHDMEIVRTTLAHDIGGALRRDTRMLPRVNGAWYEEGSPNGS